MPCASITVEIKNIIYYSGKFSQDSIVVDLIFVDMMYALTPTMYDIIEVVSWV